MQLQALMKKTQMAPRRSPANRLLNVTLPYHKIPLSSHLQSRAAVSQTKLSHTLCTFPAARIRMISSSGSSKGKLGRLQLPKTQRIAHQRALPMPKRGSEPLLWNPYAGQRRRIDHFQQQQKKFISHSRTPFTKESNNILKDLIEENQKRNSEDQANVFKIDRELYMPFFVTPYALYPNERLSIRVFDHAQLAFLNWHRSLPQIHPYYNIFGFVPSVESTEELHIGILPSINSQGIGTLVEVLEDNDIPNGKHLYLRGLDRFHITYKEQNEQFGFWQGSFKIFTDYNGKQIPGQLEGLEPEPEEQEHEDEEKLRELQATIEEAIIRGLKDHEEYKQLQEQGVIPASDEPIEFSYWLAAALPHDILPYPERLELYGTRSTAQRLTKLLAAYEKMVKEKEVAGESPSKPKDEK